MGYTTEDPIEYSLVEDAMLTAWDKSKELAKERHDDDVYNNPHHREYQRLRSLLRFMALFSDIKPQGKGLILLNDKFVISLRGRKWRNKGKGKWYRYQDPYYFLDK